jgi:hypothetical protein
VGGTLQPGPPTLHPGVFLSLGRAVRLSGSPNSGFRAVIEFWPNPFWEVCTTNIDLRELLREPDSQKAPGVSFLRTILRVLGIRVAGPWRPAQMTNTRKLCRNPCAP